MGRNGTRHGVYYREPQEREIKTNPGRVTPRPFPLNFYLSFVQTSKPWGTEGGTERPWIVTGVRRWPLRHDQWTRRGIEVTKGLGPCRLCDREVRTPPLPRDEVPRPTPLPHQVVGNNEGNWKSVEIFMSSGK